MLRRTCSAVVVFAAALATPVGTQSPSPDWPSVTAAYVLEPVKVAGGEMTDPFWLHLHHGGAPEELAFSLKLIAWSERHWEISNNRDIPLSSLPAGHEVRYTVRGVPVSPWLPLTASEHTVRIDDPALSNVKDGIHDVSLEVRGPNRGDFQPVPMFLHLHRHREVEPTVPVMTRDWQARSSAQDQAWAGPNLVYVNVADRRPRGFPADPSVIPWRLAPNEQANLYLEELTPHANLFMAQQMWWEEPPGTPSAGLKFARSLAPKLSCDIDVRGCYDAGNGSRPIGFGDQGQRAFPYRDGPRGIGWMTSYVWGQVDSTGGFAFAEAGGPVRYLKPDGELITVAGWRVRADKDPVWWLKPLNLIRQNMELRGTWLSGQYPDQSGFRLPLDVTIDPKNQNIWYVAGFYDHCIWKIEITDRTTMAATVSVFAGDPNHSYGYTDGTGSAARFKGPHSLTFDPVSDTIYVADQDNDAIRRITRAGVVSTVFGGPGMASRLEAAGATQMFNEAWYDVQRHSRNRAENRQLSRFVVSDAEAAAGIRPDIYLPYVVRVNSRGHLVLYEAGYGAIRTINPATGETRMLVDLRPNIEDVSRLPVWLDVDRWGNSGPLDGVYFGVLRTSVLIGLPDRRTNELWAWVSSNGGDARWIFGEDNDAHPHGWGLRERTDPPHYPWAVSVDPRGGVLFTGIGEHGISRLRMRRSTDPVPANYTDYVAGHYLWWRLYNPNNKMDLSRGTAIPALKFGWGGHNTLGFADAWSAAGRSNQEIINAFEIPQSVQQDPESLRVVLNYIRLNSGVADPASSSPTFAPSAPTGVRIIR